MWETSVAGTHRHLEGGGCSVGRYVQLSSRSPQAAGFQLTLVRRSSNNSAIMLTGGLKFFNSARRVRQGAGFHC